MKKVKGLVAIGVSLVISTALLSGCSSNGMVLFKSFLKTQTIKSMETQTDLEVSLSAENMSAQEQQVMKNILPIINGAKVSALTKINQNEAKTVSKLASDIKVEAGGISINTGIWADVDYSGDKPKIKEVFKIPPMLASSDMKDLQGKQYLLMDLASSSGFPNTVQPDYKKILEFSKEFQPKVLDFVTKYANQYNPTVNAITKIGSSTIVQSNGTQQADIYELKLDDSTFKQLIRYTSSNFMQNKDAINFIKEYVQAISNITELSTGEGNIDKDELDKSFDELEKNIPQLLEQLNKALDKIEGIKIIGNRGIDIKYAINADGYIINESGNMDFVFDTAKIAQLAGSNQSTGDFTGVYTLGIDFKNDIRNINGDVKVIFPELNESNSLDLMKMIEKNLSNKDELLLTNAREMVKNAKSTKVFVDYNNAYGVVMNLPKEQRDALLKDLYSINEEVHTPDVKKALSQLTKLTQTKDIKSYNELYTTITTEIKDNRNRAYLVTELLTWGKNSVFTQDVTTATDAVIEAWKKKDDISIKAAASAIEKVNNAESKKWLLEQLDEVRAYIKK